jgi:hypothetical protein
VNDHSTSTLPWQQRLRSITPKTVAEVAPETWFWALTSGIAVFYGLRAAWYFFDMNAALHFDDGYVTAVGERLLDGRLLPYVDAASHRGPVMYWLAALAQALGGRMEWYGIRALASLAFLTSLFGLWGAALLVRRRLVGAIGALSFVFISLCLLELQTVFGLVGEAMATPWIVAAFLVTTLALGRPQTLRARCALLGAAGVLSSLSGLTKQTYLIVVVPLALWAVAVALSDAPEGDAPEGDAPEGDSKAESTRVQLRRWAPVGALALGWLLPLLCVVLLYAVKGKLGTFYYWFYRYNVDVYMAPYADAKVPKALYRWARDNGFLSFALVLLLTSVAGQHVAPVLAAGRGLARAYAKRGFELTLWLQALLGLAIGFSTLRFWQQYFLPPVPWLALLIGLGLEHGLGRNPHQPRVERTSWAPLLALTLGLGGFSVVMMEQLLYGLARERENGSFVDARPERLCTEIDRFAPAGEPLYIWGFDAEYYITCQRHPASRYVYSTLISGSVPPDWGIHLEWSARGSIDALLDDLEATQPPLILDSPQRVHGVSMTQIELLNQFLHESYCDVGQFRSNDGRRMTGWQRKDLCPRRAAAALTTPLP